MQGMTEEEYAMKFCMLIVLDEKKIAGMTQYMDRFKNILDSYSRLIKNHPGIILDGDLRLNKEEQQKQAKILREICKAGNIGLVLRQSSLAQSVLFHLLVEAINRTMILVHFYAPNGDLLGGILRATYCTPKKMSDVALSMELHLGTSTFYRRRQQAITFAGFFFFEVVLPEMAGLI